MKPPLLFLLGVAVPAVVANLTLDVTGGRIFARVRETVPVVLFASDILRDWNFYATVAARAALERRNPCGLWPGQSHHAARIVALRPMERWMKV